MISPPPSFHCNRSFPSLLGLLSSTAAILCMASPFAQAQTVPQSFSKPLQRPLQSKALSSGQPLKTQQLIDPVPANMPVPAPMRGLGKNRPQHEPIPGAGSGSRPETPTPQRWHQRMPQQTNLQPAVPGFDANRPSQGDRSTNAPYPSMADLVTDRSTDRSEEPLRVPALKVPVGNAGDRSDVLTISLAQMPWVANAPAPAAAQQYRIIIDTPDPVTQPQIQAYIQWLIPSAFPTLLEGRRVIQVGQFQELSEGARQNANQLMQMLISAGFWPRIYPQP